MKKTTTNKVEQKEKKPCTTCKDKWAKVLKEEEIIQPEESIVVEETTEEINEDVVFLKEIQKSKLMESENVDKLFALYNKIHNTRTKRCNCPGLIRTFIERLNKYYNI